MAKYNRHKDNKLAPATPQEVDKVRRRTLHIVRDNLPRAEEVLSGKRTWNAQQVRLFTNLLNKVMPELKHERHDHSHTGDLSQLSQAELEAIAAQQEARAAPRDVTDSAGPVPVEPEDPNPDPKAFREEVENFRARYRGAPEDEDGRAMPVKNVPESFTK